MLFLVALSMMLVAGGVTFALLGAEDTKHHVGYTPVQMGVPVKVAFWEDSLPGKPSLPWSQTTAEWAASVEGK